MQYKRILVGAILELVQRAKSYFSIEIREEGDQDIFLSLRHWRWRSHLKRHQDRWNIPGEWGLKIMEIKEPCNNWKTCLPVNATAESALVQCCSIFSSVQFIFAAHYTR